MKEELVMPVGKYAGQRISEIPEPYLKWILTQDFPDEIKTAVGEALLTPKDTTIPKITVSKHAFDQFSLRFMAKWLWKGHDVGFGTFVTERAIEAWALGRDVTKDHRSLDGIVKIHKDIKWVYEEDVDGMLVVTCM